MSKEWADLPLPPRQVPFNIILRCSKNNIEGVTGETGHWLRRYDEWSWRPESSAHIPSRHPPNSCNSKESDALFGLHILIGMHAHVHMYTHTNTHSVFKCEGKRTFSFQVAKLVRSRSWWEGQSIKLVFVFKAPYTVRCFGSCACNYSIHEAEEELFQATLGCIIYEILSYTEKHQTDSIFHLLIYIYIYDHLYG